MNSGTSARNIARIVLYLLIFCEQEVFGQPEPKIVNGKQVGSIRGYEHQVSLRVASYEYNFGAGFICGGSLIKHNLVLTAAHCVHEGNPNRFFNPSYFMIVMGNIYLSRRDNNTLEIKAKRIVGHSKYNRHTFANDIALIFLSQNVSVNHPTVKPISLTTLTLTVGKLCVISGWGHTLNDGRPSPILMAGEVIINSREECNRPNRYNDEVLSGMFCAGNFTGASLVDTCQGDSGGPLVCDGALVGITSNGRGCAIVNYPGVYIDVQYYKKWITENSSGRLKINVMLLICVLVTIYLKHE